MSLVLTIFIIALGLIIAIIGLIGCILPVLPGPPLSFLALIVLSMVKNWEPFSTTFLIIMAVLTILVTILDYVMPAAGAKKYGASKLSVWGSILGMFLGLFVFPPWGMLIGAFVGALLGEIVTGKGGQNALRAGWGVFVGNIFGVGLKMALSATILVFYIIKMF